MLECPLYYIQKISYFNQNEKSKFDLKQFFAIMLYELSFHFDLMNKLSNVNKPEAVRSQKV